jgi:hypothetical protein
MADLQVRPRHRRKAILYDTLNGSDLFLLDWNECFANPDDLDYARRHQNGQAVVRVHAAEEIPGEQWHFDFLYAIRPVTSVFADGQKALVTCVFQQQSRTLLSSSSGHNREPWPLLIPNTHIDSV